MREITGARFRGYLLAAGLLWGVAGCDRQPPPAISGAAPRVESSTKATAAVEVAPDASEDAGRRLAREVVTALGGEEAWNDTSWDLGFDFVVERGGKEVMRASHLWHRATNDYTVSGLTQDGKAWRAHFDDVFAKRGTATLEGRTPDDSTVAQLLELGYGRFINDGYWFLMPMKLLDPGVHHRREADTVIDGAPHRVLAIWFDQVGLTPGDRYWLYVDSATGRPTRWRFLLQNGRPGIYRWDEYRKVGPLTLATVKRSLDGTSAIRFEKIRAGRLRE